MARDVVWHRTHGSDLADNSDDQGFWTISSAALGETITRVRFRITFTADEQFPFGSLGAYIGFGLYLTASEASGPFFPPLDNPNSVDWLWWETVATDPTNTMFDSAGASTFTWTNTISSSLERDVKAQRKAGDPGSVLLLHWQQDPLTAPACRFWTSFSSSTAILLAP